MANVNRKFQETRDTALVGPQTRGTQETTGRGSSSGQEGVSMTGQHNTGRGSSTGQESGSGTGSTRTGMRRGSSEYARGLCAREHWKSERERGVRECERPMTERERAMNERAGKPKSGLSVFEASGGGRSGSSGNSSPTDR